MTGSSGSNGLASWCFCGFSAIYHFTLVEDLDQSEAGELSGGGKGFADYAIIWHGVTTLASPVK